ncbi:uncharacterized protein LOC143253267 [Tachypleus tridentatus]|uniref:uncharacterized protein LOC143253267 n=1 Tax=Tachypleus tridentatus TaxID=6853 RepID=UPI003FD20FDC
MSSVWCKEQYLSSSSLFNAFLFTKKPSVNPRILRYVFMSNHMKLMIGDRKYRRFYILKGSSITVSVCARLSGGVLSILRGHHSLRLCLHEYLHPSTRGHNTESEESDEESDDMTSSLSSSQDVASNETSDPFVCHYALLHVPLRYSYRCARTAKLHQDFDPRNIITFNVTSSDYYYVLFLSNSVLDILPNEMYAEFLLKRTVYDYETSLQNCSNVTSCNLPLKLGSNDQIVVEIPPTSFGKWANNVITSKCVPRQGLYFLFFFFLSLMFVICAFHC